MKKITIIGVVILFLITGGFIFFRMRSTSSNNQSTTNPTPTASLEPIGDQVKVNFEPNKARTKAKLVINNLLEAGVESLEYEILYETEGLIKGVNSGSSPIEVDNSGVVERDIDFGTCSSGVCQYDKNIGKITLVIKFSTSTGPKIFKKEYL